MNLEGDIVLAAIVGGGVGVWCYVRFQRRSSSSTKNSAIAAAIVAIFIGFLLTFGFQYVFHRISK
jgi:hypothetical protein